jgi:uncharacterized protein YegL
MKTKLTGMEFRLGLEDAGHKVCSALGLEPVSFIWSNQTTTAGIDSGGHIVLPNVDDDDTLPRVLFDRYAGYLLHELLHRKYSDFNARAEGPYLRQLHNAVEDIWIERRAINEALTGNAEPLLTSLINNIIANIKPGAANWADPAIYPFALACYGRRYANPVPIADGLQPIFDEASRRIDSATSSSDTLRIAQWVFDQLNALPESSDNPEPDQGEGEGSGDGSGDGSGSPQNDSGDAQDKSQGDDKGDQKKSPGKAVRPKGTPKVFNVEPTLKKRASKSGSFDREAGMSDIEDHLCKTRHMEIETVPGGKLRYEVKRMFENTGRDEFLPNLSRGRLNTAALHTLAAGNDKVFKRRREIAGIDSAVCVLIDVSGSMRRAQTQVAVSTAYALLESLEQAGVKTSVLTFGSRVAVLKPFESRSIKRHRDLLRSLGDGGGTNDYYAVRIAHEMLSKQDAQRKVVFVLTDGMGDMDSTKAQIKSGEALGITTVGVGICEDVSFVYAKSVTVNDLTEVAHTSFRQIKLAA